MDAEEEDLVTKRLWQFYWGAQGAEMDGWVRSKHAVDGQTGRELAGDSLDCPQVSIARITNLSRCRSPDILTVA